MATPPFGNWFAGNDTPYNKSNTLLGVGLGLLSGKTAQDQVGQAASNFANERQMGRTYNKTLNFLQSANPQLAQAVEAGAIDPATAYKLHFASQAKADRPRTFQTLPDGTYGFADPDTNSFNALGKAPKPASENGLGAGEAGLNLVYGQDSQGNTIAWQPLKGGGLRQVELPNGAKLTPGISNIDLGTGTLTVNTKTGAPITTTPKDVMGASQQSAFGKDVAEAQSALPSAVAAAKSIDSQIQSLKSDPYLPDMLGPVDARLPNISSDAARVQGKIDQIKGGAFLQARQILKGGGAITDFEGQKAEQAYTRMNQAQSVSDFNNALDDFNSAVQQGVRKLESQARQSQTSAPASTAAPGTVRRYNPATGKIE